MEQIWELVCHLDHLTGEQLGYAITEIMAGGALDVLWTPGIGKKNRPSGELRVLCAVSPGEEQLRQVQELIFRHTHTLGLRRNLVERLYLPRESTVADTAHGEIEAKSYRLGGSRYVRLEHEGLVRASRSSGQGLPGLFNRDDD